MADSVLVTDGTTSIQLVYNASSQTEYKLKYGAQVGIDPPDVLTHTPDFGESLPVRGVDRDRTVTLGMHFPPQSDWDDVLNSISKLKRMVDGAHSQALRYWTDGDVDRVNLRIQLNGSSNYTDIPIKYGVVDDGGALYSAPAILNQTGYDAAVVLIVGPYGEGAAITLRNDLPSSPHFVEDSNSDGLADGWTNVNTATCTINVSNYLTGGRSQQVNGNSLSGIASGAVTATAPQVVAYAWIRPFAGSVRFRVRDNTAAVVVEKILSNGDPGGVSDRQWVNPINGTTWYRVSYSGTLVNNNPYLQILSNASSSGFLVDNAYLQVGTLTIPNAWCSTSSITNGHDLDASANNINYIDFWGIPGDSESEFTMTVTPTASTVDGYIVGRWAEGARSYGIHWVSDIDATSANTTKLRYSDLALDGTRSAVADGNRFSDEYLRLTADASPAADYLLVPLYSSSSQATAETQYFNFLNSPHRIYLLARSSSTSTTFELFDQSVDIWTTKSSGVLSPAAVSTWQLFDLGYMSAGNNSNLIEDTYSSFSSFDPYIQVKVTPGAASATVDVNAVLMVPISSGGSFAVFGSNALAGGVISSGSIIKSGGGYYKSTDSYAYLGVVLGELDGMLPGQKMTRYVFAMTNETTYIDLPVATTATISTAVIPRTRHLLGVK